MAYTFTTIASFTSTNGATPAFGALITDAAGDLFGTTSIGGSSGYGTVFEIPHTGSTYGAVTTLAAFNNTNGANPYAGLITDAAGDLFGTTSIGGSSGYGTVFEIPHTGSTYGAVTTLAAFNNTNGANPYAGLIMDAAGDLFGTTQQGGGISNSGTVFEIPHTGSTYGAVTTLAAFDGANGAFSYAALITDAAGDLFGTTSIGGSSGYGTVFEIPHTGSTYGAVTTLATFNNTNGAAPQAGLITDAAGDLFGTTQQGGSFGYGTVFEIPHTGSTYGPVTTLFAFNGANGAAPIAALIADPAGDLFGTTEQGGSFGYGTVFELIPEVISPVAPTITGTVAGQTTTSEAPDHPFSGVTIGDFNSGATDTLTISLAGSGGTLSGTGLSGSGSTYTLAGSASAVTSALDALTFTPHGGAPNTSSTTTFALSDTSSAFATPTVDSKTSVIDKDPAVAPTISGTVAGQTTTSEAPDHPFSGVTIGDFNSGATDTLTITLAGSGGTLSGTGLSGSGSTYTLAGSASAVTSALDALTFTPHGGAPNTNSTTTFALSDKSSAYATPTVETTSVIDKDPAVAPTISGTVAGQTTTSEAPDHPFSGVTIGDLNSGATDTLTITLAGSGGTLSGTGLSGSGSTYTLAGSASAVTSALDALTFTPHGGAPNTNSTTTFALSDKSSAYATPTVETTSVIDKDPAVAPTISGTVAGQTTTSEAPDHPFSGVTIGDLNSGATDTLTITLAGSGGTLSGTGLSGSGSTYTLAGSASAVTSALDALTFTPHGGAPNTSSTTTFALSDTSSAFATPTVDGKTSVIDSDPDPFQVLIDQEISALDNVFDNLAKQFPQVAGLLDVFHKAADGFEEVVDSWVSLSLPSFGILGGAQPSAQTKTGVMNADLTQVIGAPLISSGNPLIPPSPNPGPFAGMIGAAI